VDEGQLIARAKAGDTAAERSLYEAHVDRIYRLAFRLTGNDDVAQDLTQEAFIRAFNHLGDFRGESSFSTWMHSVATSVILNGLKKVKRFHQREMPIDDAQHVGVSGRIAEPDLKVRLRHAIDALPDIYRLVFVMHDVEGFTHPEIAGALKVAVGTSRARLFEARARLRVALADFAGEWVS